MRIIKEPFTCRNYIIGGDTNTGELLALEEWLNSYGKDKWRVSGAYMLEIIDPKVETMFILKWVK